tara:strand:+ start:271982 stop:273232 length:1251 start_codon:yes stop_codon:yes gene_type:complete
MIAALLVFGQSFSAVKDTKAKSKVVNKELFKSVNALQQSSLVNTTVISPGADISSSAVAGPLESESAEKSIIKEKTYFFSSNTNSNASLVATAHETEMISNGIIFQRGLYYGFAIMVILLNLVCYFLFEEKVFVFFSMALASMTATFFFSDGLLSLLGLNIINTPAMQSTLLFFAAGFTAVFASHYLTLSEYFPRIKYVSLGIMGFAFMMIFSGWVSETEFFTGVANSLLIGLMGLYFMIGVSLFSKKNYAKFYVIATAIPMLFAIDYFVLSKFGINFLNTESFHLKSAGIVEMLVLTYAIMYRMKAIKEEHQLRQTELRIFLKRQEVLNRTNTAKLMQDVYLENLIMQYDLDGLEIKLLQYISEGKDNAKIARKLKTTEVEVEFLTRELYEKLEISEQIQEDYRMVDTQPDYIYN